MCWNFKFLLPSLFGKDIRRLIPVHTTITEFAFSRKALELFEGIASVSKFVFMD